MKIPANFKTILGVILGVIIGAVGFYVIAKTNKLCYKDTNTSTAQRGQIPKNPILTWLCLDKITKLEICNASLQRYTNKPFIINWQISNDTSGNITVTGINESISNVAAIYYDSVGTIVVEINCTHIGGQITTTIPVDIPFPASVAFAIKDPLLNYTIQAITKKYIFSTVYPTVKIFGTDTSNNNFLTLNLNITYYQPSYSFKTRGYLNLQDAKLKNDMIEDVLSKTLQIQPGDHNQDVLTDIKPKDAGKSYFLRIFIEKDSYISFAEQIIANIIIVNPFISAALFIIDKNITDDQFTTIFLQPITKQII